MSASKGVEAGGGLALAPQPPVAGTSANIGGCYKNWPAERHPREQHEHISWIVEQSNGEKRAQSGTS